MVCGGVLACDAVASALVPTPDANSSHERAPHLCAAARTPPQRGRQELSKGAAVCRTSRIPFIQKTRLGVGRPARENRTLAAGCWTRATRLRRRRTVGLASGPIKIQTSRDVRPASGAPRPRADGTPSRAKGGRVLSRGEEQSPATGFASAIFPTPRRRAAGLTAGCQRLRLGGSRQRTLGVPSMYIPFLLPSGCSARLAPLSDGPQATSRGRQEKDCVRGAAGSTRFPSDTCNTARCLTLAWPSPCRGTVRPLYVTAGLLPRVFPASKPDTFATCPPPATVARQRPRREIHTSVASATRTADSVSITGRPWPLCPTNAANNARSSPSGDLVRRQAAARPDRSRSIHQGKKEEGGCRPRPPPPAFHAPLWLSGRQSLNGAQSAAAAC